MAWKQRTPAGGYPVYGLASSKDGLKLACLVRNSSMNTVTVSTDGGATWGAPVATVAGPSTGPYIACSQDASVITVSTGVTTANGVMVSTNSGATWAATVTSPGIAARAIAMSTDGMTIAVHGGTAVKVTYDRGNTWTSIDSALSYNSGDPCALALSDDGTIVAYSSGATMNTYNKTTGVKSPGSTPGTWAAADMNPTGSIIVAVDIASATMLRYASGTWQKLTIPAAAKSVAISDDGTVILIGQAAASTSPYLSRDSGSSWQLQGFGSTATACVSANGLRMASSPAAGGGTSVWTNDDTTLPTQTWTNMFFGAKQVQSIYNGWNLVWRHP